MKSWETKETVDDLIEIRTHLVSLYGESEGQAAYDRVTNLLDHYRGRIPAARLARLSQRDALLITYGDQVTQPGEPPLKTLADFCARHLSGVVSGVHILPFYPYTSDDGFSVVDYLAVDPSLGDWVDIARFRDHFLLMFDLVINHVSASSAWFQFFLQGSLRYRDYFIKIPEDADLSNVIRPRALPLSHLFQVEGQPRKIWTTFSADQVDLNYQNPAVLVDILDVLLSYVEHGAEFIRLDAVAYLWKTYGTTCLHLPQTHRVIQLVRAVLDQIAPHVVLITETNVPHAENLSYFGDGSNEAQLVYNFALPPLTLHTLQTGNAEALQNWAAGLSLPSRRATFFNFLASHDGIGLNPARGILTSAEIDAVIERVKAHGGLVSYKNDPGGATSPYELNINYFDALNNPFLGESPDTQVQRFMASQAIMLSLVGVPGIYFHSLFGSRGWPEGARQTGHHRTINREKYKRSDLEAQLADAGSNRHKIQKMFTQLLRIRAAQTAFDPYGEMAVLESSQQVFAVLRWEDLGPPVLCLQNISNQAQAIDPALFREGRRTSPRWTELVTGKTVAVDRAYFLEPYQTAWLSNR